MFHRPLLIALLAGTAHAQVEPHAGMLRYPDVGKTQIAFAYAGDIWLAPRAGGQATRLTTAPGSEAFPKFSPDDQTLAFLGNYEGNRDIYTIPTAGGVAFRVTHHPGTEVLCDWTNDGRLTFSLSGLAGLRRQSELFAVPATGGMPTTLPVPYGANGSLNADSTWLAYTPHSTDNRTWKRYRGGMATDVWLFNLKDNSSKQITTWEGTDTLPMWNGDKVYYLSDQGPEHRLNIWVYEGGKNRQVTSFKDFDVKWPSMGPGAGGKGEIVYQFGSGLFLLDLASERSTQVKITIPGDRPTVRTRTVDAANLLSGWSISPSGKRVAAEARGDIWSLPAENGTPRALTRTSGVAERSPSWSADGKWIAYFSDATGEYELYITQSDGLGATKQLTKADSAPAAFRFNPTWSPDSKHITFTDKAGRIFLHTLAAEDKEGAEGTTKLIDTDPSAGQPGISWSSDSKWITYSYQLHARQQSAVFLYNVEKGERHHITSGMFADGSPVFDRKGDYLFYVSSRTFNPTYSDIDNSFIYNGSQVILAVPLRADMESPWAPKSDEEDFKASAKKDDKKDEKKDEAKPGEKKPDEAKAADDGVSGTWEGKAAGGEPLPPEGLPITLKINLAKDGTVTGTLTSPLHEGSISHGKWDAASKTLTFTLAVNDSMVQFTATIEGESLKGSASVNDVNFTISAKRTAQAAGESKKADGKKDEPKNDDAKKDVVIDLDGLEGRAMALPIRAGAFGGLAVNDKNQLLFVRRPVAGDGESGIKLFDLSDEKKEEKSVTSGGGFDITPDGKKLLVPRGNGAAVMDASAGATAKNVVTSGMSAKIEPRLEWKQVFTDAWRLQRDFFYDPNMHQVNWNAVREQYAKMLDDCGSREDVSYVISEMISELNVGHAYYREGEADGGPSVSVGMLGCDFELVPAANGEPAAYRIKRIIAGGPWDSDARGPLSQPGVKVKVGDYVMAVNGVPVDASQDIWAAFLGMAGKTITLTVNDKPSLERPVKKDEPKKDEKKDDAKKEPRKIEAPKDLRDVVVTTLGSEDGLRFRAWVESKRAYVEKQTDGKVGYIYVPDTGVDGQNNLFRQFYGQAHKQALIIDDRWNGGGQIPTRFIELLNRPVTNYWAKRDGDDWQWPPDSAQGAKCMLINGLAGSGGDMFPWLFRFNKLGKLIGMRTWGGLVGISGNPGMIDGSGVTVPTFGFYKKDGTWGVEGHGVDPDMLVIDDPAKMTAYRDGTGGSDPQLDAAIKHMLEEIAQHPYTPPKKPAYPDRNGMGIPEKDR